MMSACSFPVSRGGVVGALAMSVPDRLDLDLCFHQVDAAVIIAGDFPREGCGLAERSKLKHLLALPGAPERARDPGTEGAVIARAAHADAGCVRRPAEPALDAQPEVMDDRGVA